MSSLNPALYRLVVKAVALDVDFKVSSSLPRRSNAAEPCDLDLA